MICLTWGWITTPSMLKMSPWQLMILQLHLLLGFIIITYHQLQQQCISKTNVLNIFIVRHHRKTMQRNPMTKRKIWATKVQVQLRPAWAILLSILRNDIILIVNNQKSWSNLNDEPKTPLVSSFSKSFFFRRPTIFLWKLKLFHSILEILKIFTKSPLATVLISNLCEKTFTNPQCISQEFKKKILMWKNNVWWNFVTQWNIKTLTK